MSSSTSKQALHPINPVLIKDVNTPTEIGETRMLPDGSLLYREPLTKTEVPAVRLHDIRPRLVQEASGKKSYRFAKRHGYEDTNVTAFVKKDYNYGPARENRPDCLLQLESNGTKGEKPNGYVMDEGCVVLDAFDHGLRNFGNQLPMYVSSELEGHDIEFYTRRNREISIYDLIARAPNGYYKGLPETKFQNTKRKSRKEAKASKKPEKEREWHAGPPRVGTFSMRATRFRLRAGMLSWEKKDGTVAKNQRILDVIPARYKDPAVNSTIGWRDLKKAEIKRIKDGAKKKPQQGPKAKRAAQAQQDRGEEEDIEQDSEDEEDDFEEAEEDGDEDEDALTGPSNGKTNGMWPQYNPEDFEKPMQAHQSYNAIPQKGKAPQSPRTMHKKSSNIETQPYGLRPMHPHRQSEGSLHARQNQGVAMVGTQGFGRDEDVSRLRKSRIARQDPGTARQQRSAPSPFAAGITSPPISYPVTGNSMLGQELLLASSGGGFDASFPAFHEDGSQLYNSGSAAYTGSSPSSNTHNYLGMGEYGVSVRQPQLSQRQSCSQTRQPSQQRQPSNTHAQHLAPFNQRMNSQQMPLGPQIIGKRKWTEVSLPEHFEGQRPIKRAKRHTTKPAWATQAWTPTESVPRAEGFDPTTGFEFPTQQPVAQPTAIPRTGNILPGSFPHTLPSVDEAPCSGEGFSNADQGYIPPINSQQGMFDQLGTGVSDNDPYLYDLLPNLPPSDEQQQGYMAPNDDQQGMYDQFGTVVSGNNPYLHDSLPNLRPPTNGGPWNDEGFLSQQQGYLPPINNQQRHINHLGTVPHDTNPYLQAPDTFAINQGLHNGPSQDFLPPAAFHHDQRKANQAAGWIDQNPGWTA